MKGETDLSYLSAFYYTAAVLLLIQVCLPRSATVGGWLQRASFWEAFSLVTVSGARKRASEFVSC